MRRTLTFAIASVRRPLAVSLVVLFCALEAPGAAAAGQRLVTWTLTSRFVNPAINPFNHGVHALRVNVLLPDGYDGIQRFPLLVLLHGHGDTYASWMNPANGNLLGLAPGLRAVVVMPEGGQGWYTDWWDSGARGSDGHGWESFYLDELLPAIQRRLRILPDRRYHAVAGLSMGGEGAAYLASQRPDYFGTIASFSGVLSLLRPEWPTGFNTQGQDFQTVYGAPDGFYVHGHDPTTLATNLSNTRVFVRVGDGLVIPPYENELTNTFGMAAEAELRQHAQDFVAAAQAAGAPVHYEPVHGIHDWPWWRMAFVSALQWGLFGQVAEAPQSWTYRTVRTKGRAWDLRFRFASPPAALETLHRAGDRLTGTGSGTVTITPESGRAFTVTMPFSRRLVPAPAIRSIRTTRHGRELRYTLTQPATVRIRIEQRACGAARRAVGSSGGIARTTAGDASDSASAGAVTGASAGAVARRTSAGAVAARTSSRPVTGHCHTTRYRSLLRHGRAGANLVRIRARIHGRRLPAGRYLVTAIASNTNGVSPPVTVVVFLR